MVVVLSVRRDSLPSAGDKANETRGSGRTCEAWEARRDSSTAKDVLKHAWVTVSQLLHSMLENIMEQ